MHDALRAAATRVAPSPADNITNWPLRYGGDALTRVLRLGYTYVLRCGVPPAAWLEGYVSWIWKGRKDRLCWRSYRGIVLGSNMAKGLERILLRRLLLFIERTGALFWVWERHRREGPV